MSILVKYDVFEIFVHLILIASLYIGSISYFIILCSLGLSYPCKKCMWEQIFQIKIAIMAIFGIIEWYFHYGLDHLTVTAFILIQVWEFCTDMGITKQLGKPWVCLIVRLNHVRALDHENHNRNCLFRGVIVPILWGHIPLCVVYLPWKYHYDCFIGLGDMTNLVCMSISLENRFYRQSW